MTPEASVQVSGPARVVWMQATKDAHEPETVPAAKLSVNETPLLP
jgi:hypothetical protein